MTQKIIHLVAVSSNQVIGVDGNLPWRIPTDLQRFKSITMGHPIVMGRKTFDSLKRILPGRLNVVISRSPQNLPAGVMAVPSWSAALACCQSEQQNWPGPIFVIGGGEIYAQTMGDADEVLLTRVHIQISGDTFYPPINTDLFELVTKEDFLDHHPPYSYESYRRRNPKSS